MKKEMFKDIIGYDKVKKSLERVIDVLNDKSKYKELGCVIPHGLLLYGDPGLGKSTYIYNKAYEDNYNTFKIFDKILGINEIVEQEINVLLNK